MEWLWNLPYLKFLELSDNSFKGFEGSVETLVNSSVEIFLLESNKFEGALPHLPLSITALFAGGNNFAGEIPVSVCNRSSLSLLDLSYNNFTGLIPHCLSNFTYVNLRRNNLEGSIPDKFYVGSPLQSLDVGFNRLRGKLPKSLLNCSSLQLLTVENNMIKDTFPFWLKALPNFEVLILSSNKFYGPIAPPHQGPLGFLELRIFEISDNNFTGSLPRSFFVNWKSTSLTANKEGSIYMIYLRSAGSITAGYMNRIDLRYKGLRMEQKQILIFYSAINLCGNKLEGKIPESIGLLEGLIALDLSNNDFTGHIPHSLANLKNLESLDLSRNQLSETIPSGLGSLSFLAYVNVSHNDLSGVIPQGTQITGQPKSCFEGNARLCGMPLDIRCYGTNTPPTQPSIDEEEEEEEQVLNWRGVVVGYGPGFILGLTIAQVISSCKPEWFLMIIGLTKRRNR